MSLPQCKTGFVYFLISARTRDYTYIGECKCLVDRLYQHNSGHGSKSTTPAHRRPFAIMGYICGFLVKILPNITKYLINIITIGYWVLWIALRASSYNEDCTRKMPST